MRQEARGDVHAVAVNLLPAVLDVAQVHAGAEHYLRTRGIARVLGRECFLDFHDGLHGVQRAAELEQEAVAGGLDFAAAMLRHDLADDGALTVEQPGTQRLVAMDQLAVTDDVGEDDRRKAATR